MGCWLYGCGFFTSCEVDLSLLSLSNSIVDIKIAKYHKLYISSSTFCSIYIASFRRSLSISSNEKTSTFFSKDIKINCTLTVLFLNCLWIIDTNTSTRDALQKLRRVHYVSGALMNNSPLLKALLMRSYPIATRGPQMAPLSEQDPAPIQPPHWSVRDIYRNALWGGPEPSEINKLLNAPFSIR
jgi:hypothetical protein